MTIQGNSASTGNTATNSNLIFKVGDSGATTAMTILNNGNVGIKKADPTADLHVNGALVIVPVALTDAATIATDASTGNIFTVSITGDQTLAVPTNPTDGQKCVWRVTASGANRTLTLASGPGGFRFGTTITALTIITSGKTDYIGAIYNSTAGYWDVVAYSKGF